MPVVCAETGKRIGRVKSVFVDKRLLRVTGLTVSAGLGRTAFYPKSSISLLGIRAVMISGGKGDKEEGEAFSLRRAMNVSGEMIGAVTNAFADEETLEIKRLEMSRDIFLDIARGRRTCRLYSVNEETSDCVIYEEGE
ncbi:MAG: hypothetical protein IKJ65_06175 [Clostridia bacterium]|nr:hypothetical protein [Clostridia bacterium]